MEAWKPSIATASVSARRRVRAGDEGEGRDDGRVESPTGTGWMTVAARPRRASGGDGPRRAAAGARSDVDDLVEAVDEELDELVARLGDWARRPGTR